MSRRTACTAAAAGIALLSAGCGTGGAADAGEDHGRTLTVLAASSLTEAFGELERSYERDHDGVDVQLTFDSSSTLAEQVIAGAPAEVLATADEATMQRVVAEGLTAEHPVRFARNRLTLVTPPGDPAGVGSIGDLDSGEVTYAVCVPAAPCGAASTELLDIVGVTADPVTEEDNVRDVLTKVTTGEVDAGLVYVSDAQAAGSDVRVVDVPESDRVLNADIITVLVDADDPALAEAWVRLVTGAEGQRVLESYGFLPAA